MDFRRTTVAELAARVQARDLSARELVAHSLAEIERLDPTINAFCAVDGDRAMADAAALDERVAAGEQVGPLAGIPLGVKDLEEAAGFVTSFGSALHAGDPPATSDSPHVARLRAAGCVVVGKTNTPEQGFKGVTENPTFGVTRNPWSIEHSPGGSSGGSGAAIAAGMVPLATGTDGGGSIRIPSSLCGLSGLKPSQGRVPNGGERPPGSMILSTRGPMARTIRDVALALDACVGPDPTDVFSFPGLHDPWAAQLHQVAVPERVVFSRTMGVYGVDREVAEAVEGAVELLADAGSEVIVVDQVLDEDPTLAWFHLWCATRARTLGHLVDSPDWERIDPELRQLVEFGLGLSAVDVVRAVDEGHMVNLRLETTVFSKAPLLLTPTIGGQPPRIGAQGTIDGEETPSWVGFTPFANLTRNPAGTVACGITASGIPIGLQVVGAQREDLQVLQGIVALEDLLGFDAVAPAR
jgi:aspartyl-tRNA(Asn)/glutamyl-tRNA(Gln) amidotransferase subunit A